MKESYDDIIGLSHHTSAKHPRMSILDRAAQFAPFSALSGYGAALAETARLTEQRINLTEEELLELDHKQQILMANIDKQPEITVTWFCPDERKDGGEYITTTGSLRRIDEVRRVVVLVDGTEISMDDIYSLMFSKTLSL